MRTRSARIFGRSDAHPDSTSNRAPRLTESASKLPVVQRVTGDVCERFLAHHSRVAPEEAFLLAETLSGEVVDVFGRPSQFVQSARDDVQVTLGAGRTRRSRPRSPRGRSVGPSRCRVVGDSLEPFGVAGLVVAQRIRGREDCDHFSVVDVLPMRPDRTSGDRGSTRRSAPRPRRTARPVTCPLWPQGRRRCVRRDGCCLTAFRFPW